MKLVLAVLFAAILSVGAFAQDVPEKKKATPEDNVAVFDGEGLIRRGADLGDSKLVSLANVMKEPGKYVGEQVRVTGVIVRSCKMEGCWAELAPDEDSKQSVRVRFKDHQFFIPLKSEGFQAKAEGVFALKVLSKEEADHLVEDGAEFPLRNADGSVNEISFVASGIVLSKSN